MKVVNFLRDGIKTNQDVLHSNFDLPKSQVRNKTFCWDIALSFETDMTVWLLGLSKWSCQDLISPTRKKKKKFTSLGVIDIQEKALHDFTAGADCSN